MHNPFSCSCTAALLPVAAATPSGKIPPPTSLTSSAAPGDIAAAAAAPSGKAPPPHPSPLLLRPAISRHPCRRRSGGGRRCAAMRQPPPPRKRWAESEGWSLVGRGDSRRDVGRNLGCTNHSHPCPLSCPLPSLLMPTPLPPHAYFPQTSPYSSPVPPCTPLVSSFSRAPGGRRSSSTLLGRPT